MCTNINVIKTNIPFEKHYGNYTDKFMWILCSVTWRPHSIFQLNENTPVYKERRVQTKRVILSVIFWMIMVIDTSQKLRHCISYLICFVRNLNVSFQSETLLHFKWKNCWPWIHSGIHVKFQLSTSVYNRRYGRINEPDVQSLLLLEMYVRMITNTPVYPFLTDCMKINISSQFHT